MFAFLAVWPVQPQHIPLLELSRETFSGSFPYFAAGVIKTSLPNEGGSSVGTEMLIADVLLTELHSLFPHCLLQPPTNMCRIFK